MNRSAKDILFYSPKCPYSRGLLQKIQNTPIMNNIVPFNVNDTKYQIPGFVKAVPTLFLVQRREVLVNQALSQWVTYQLNMHTNSQNKSINNQPRTPTAHVGNTNNPNVMPNISNQGQYEQRQYKKPIMGLKDDLKGELNNQSQGISDFNPGEMSSGFSDEYSFLENDKAVASHGFAFIGDANDTPPVTNINTANADLGDYPTQNNNNNNKAGNSQYNYNNNGGGGGLTYNPDPFADSGNSQPRYGGGGGGQGLSYNPDPFADSGNSQPRYGGGGGGGGGQGLSYNPDPFANNSSNSNNKDSEKRREFDKKFDEMMKERELSDSLVGMNY
jgi:hypothetical protein